MAEGDDREVVRVAGYSQKRSKNVLSENPNARRCRGIYFTDPKDEEFKDITKNARRKLEIPMPAATLCKTPMCQSGRETCRNVGKH